jgi:dGTPase
MDYSKLLSSNRRNETSIPNRNLCEELASDHARIVYSAPFRRLAQKAQVFSLEIHAAVRNRITHSLEVADVGRWIAYYVTEELIGRGKLTREFQLPILFAAENACLLHDIGNPPFGHFGEAAIQWWFKNNWKRCYSTSKKIKSISARDSIHKLIQDFLQFDGNPQALRLILRLQRDKNEFGLNLTYTTILSLVKYVRSPSEKKNQGLKKKPGYFESERAIILQLKEDVGVPEIARYPLTYIMEAADDIAYCISDIEDGIEKRILTAADFFHELDDEWQKQREARDPANFPLGHIDKTLEGKECFFFFKTSYSRQAIKAAQKSYLEKEKELLSGKHSSLFPDDSLEGKATKCLKNVARQRLFRSPEAENPELAGYRIIEGLLQSFEPLLSCTESDFQKLLAALDNPSAAAGKGLDLHWRLFNKLPKKYVQTYQDHLKKPFGKGIPEWYFRAHLVVDFIAGMTDMFALELYQTLNGIRLT